MTSGRENHFIFYIILHRIFLFFSLYSSSHTKHFSVSGHSWWTYIISGRRSSTVFLISIMQDGAAARSFFSLQTSLPPCVVRLVSLSLTFVCFSIFFLRFLPSSLGVISFHQNGTVRLTALTYIKVLPLPLPPPPPLSMLAALHFTSLHFTRLQYAPRAR